MMLSSHRELRCYRCELAAALGRLDGVCSWQLKPQTQEWAPLVCIRPQKNKTRRRGQWCIIKKYGTGGQQGKPVIDDTAHEAE